MNSAVRRCYEDVWFSDLFLGHGVVLRAGEHSGGNDTSGAAQFISTIEQVAFRRGDQRTRDAGRPAWERPEDSCRSKGVWKSSGGHASRVVLPGGSCIPV